MSIGGRDWKSMWLGLLEASLLLTALFSVATAFGQWHRLLELFSHFRLQYLVIAVLLTMVFLFLRWIGYAVLGAATVLLNAWFVVPWYLPNVHAEVPGVNLKVLQANVWVKNDSPDRLLKAIASEDPDIVLMQEVTPQWIQSLGTLEQRYPYSLVEARNDPFGIALYSRYPFESSVVNSAGLFASPELIVTIVVDDKRLHIIGAHTASPINAVRFGARNVQLDGLAKLAARTPSPLIVVGDLNTSMWAYHYRQFEQESGLKNARLGFGVNPTWPSFLPFAMIPIDQLLVSDGISVTNFGTGPYIGSDHLPIIASIHLD